MKALQLLLLPAFAALSAGLATLNLLEGGRPGIIAGSIGAAVFCALIAIIVAITTKD